MIIPPLLKQQDKVRIIAPSGIVPDNGLVPAIKMLELWGLEVELGSYVYSKSSVFAGTDKQRLQNFQEAINDESVSIVLCARGGYGLTRYIDHLDFTTLIDSPKWIIGFSDITAFHLSALKKNILSIHGPMGTSFAREGAEGSIGQLHNLLFNGTSEIEMGQLQIKLGEAQGTLVGGNLALLCDSIGTANEIETDNAILVLEDVGEQYYRIDRMLNQMARAGKFDKLKGLVIGGFSDLSQGIVVFSESVIDIISRLTTDKIYPIAISMPIGHEPANYPFVHGAEYKLLVEREYARLELLTTL